MELEVKERPASIAVIGWIFIIAAVVAIFSSITNFMGFTFTKYDFLEVLQIAFAIFVLIASIKFLKLRAWARGVLEVICWSGLIYMGALVASFIFYWMNMTSNITPGEGMPVLPPMFGIFGAVTGAVEMGIWSVSLIVIIKFLRGKAVREAVTKGKRGIV